MERRMKKNMQAQKEKQPAKKRAPPLRRSGIWCSKADKAAGKCPEQPDPTTLDPIPIHGVNPDYVSRKFGSDQIQAALD